MLVLSSSDAHGLDPNRTLAQSKAHPPVTKNSAHTVEFVRDGG
jgi:hypothetical protein